MYNLMYQFYFVATCFSYPKVPIIKLQIRSIKGKLFTHNLSIVINIFSGRNLGLTKRLLHIQGVTGGTDQTSGGCSLC